MSKKRYTQDDFEKDVDLLEAEKKATSPTKHRGRKIFFSILAAVILLGVGFSYRVFSSANSIFVNEGSRSVIGQITGLITGDSKDLRGWDDDRINIALFGHGGPGHPGSYLSDTNILVSVKPSTSQVSMVSIPRDLAVDIPGHPSGKMNNALAYGFQDGVGEELMIDVMENVTGQKIHYFARVDFTAFQEIIDDIGGVEVTVDRTFYDPLFPNNSYGYDPISFQAGTQTMDGETALKFARSRHGNNGEGSDFARSQRQQKILFAIKEKVLSSQTLLNPSTIIAIVDDLGDHMATNMSVGEVLDVYDLTKDIQGDDAINQVVDNSADGLLYSYVSETTGAYLLSPKAGYDNFSEIHTMIEQIFTGNPIHDERPVVEIQNGTRIAGLAGQTGQEVERVGFTVQHVGNADQRDLETTIIYELTETSKPESLTYLEQTYGAVSTTAVPDWVLSSREDPTQSEQPDFIVVLGKRHSPVNNADTLPSTTVL